MAFRKFSNSERAAYNVGRGSVLPTNAASREKMVRVAYGNNSSLIRAYKVGRMTALDRKAVFQAKQRRKARKKKVF